MAKKALCSLGECIVALGLVFALGALLAITGIFVAARAVLRPQGG